MSYTDAVGNLSNRHKLNIHFQHILSGKIVSFAAFLTDFNDKWSSDWESQTVYGRMDDIRTFKRTAREISIAWDVVAADRLEAEENLIKCSTLISMLYPTYTGDNASSISGSPLFKLKFANLISDPEMPSWGASVTDAGLVGTISGLDYKPELEPSFFISPEQGLIAKTVKLSCTFTVLHTKPVGWTGGSFRQLSYPYGFGNHGRKIPKVADGVTPGGQIGVGGSIGVPTTQTVDANVKSSETREEVEAEAENSQSDIDKIIDKVALGATLGG